MPDPISSELTAWKNQPARTDPLVSLYTVSISEETTLYLVAGDPDGSGSLSYGGNTYTSAAISQGDHVQNIEGDLPSVKVSISNVDGLAGGYIELNDLHGREVTITYVLMTSEGLNTENAISESYTIQDQAYDRESAMFVLSHANFFQKRVPTKQFLRYKCRWPYEQRFVAGNGCGYPRDEFESDTSQNLKSFGKTVEQERKFGWYSVNAYSASKWDVDETRFGSLFISTEAGSADWSAGNRSAHAMYRKLAGDFDVYTEVEFDQTRAGMFAGILCQDGSNAGTWITAGRREVVDEDGIVYSVSVALDDESQPVVTGSGGSPPTLVRMSRVGSLFKVFMGSSASGPWTELYNEIRTEFVSDVKLGLILSVSPVDIGEASVSFPYFRFTVGGLTACDRTFDGVNGCSAHSNTHRFFGFRGIPAR